MSTAWRMGMCKITVFCRVPTDIRQTFLETSRTARLATWGNPSPTTRYIWLAAHGYGQLAEYFIRPFTCLDPDTHFVVAPEGLSRYYLQGVDGRVGASWMTREARQLEIADQHAYLDRVWQWISGQVPTAAQLITLGFSQGVPTILRWLDQRDLPVKHIVCWAGSPPEDALLSVPYLHEATQWLVWGDNDDYINEASQHRIRSYYNERNWTPQEILFNGGHQIPQAVLRDLADRITGSAI